MAFDELHAQAARRVKKLEDALRELLDSREAEEVARRDIWSMHRTENVNAAMTRSSKATQAARALLALGVTVPCGHCAKDSKCATLGCAKEAVARRNAGVALPLEGRDAKA